MTVGVPCCWPSLCRSELHWVEVFKQYRTLAAKAELAQLQAPRSLLERQTLYKHALGERLSSSSGVLGRPAVR